jgi:hypothetical protein
MKGSAIISPCGSYRYSLSRVWDDGPTLAWCMLNPSTADADVDDPTVRKCIGFAKRWGFGGIHVVNLFALRATDPRELRIAKNPVGPGNSDALMKAFSRYPVVVAWGGSIPRTRDADNAARSVRDSARRGPRGLEWWCLGRTRYGEPRHPLMLAYATPRLAWPICYTAKGYAPAPAPDPEET